MQYSFSSFPNPAAPIYPVATAYNAGATIDQGSGVVLADGRVLHVWYEWDGSSPRNGYLLCGYSPDVITYLTVADSVVYDRTLIHNSNDSSISGIQAYYVMGTVCRGPDNNLWLGVMIAGDDASLTYDATFEAPGTLVGNHLFAYTSTDEGDTWDLVHSFTGQTNTRHGGSGNTSLIGPIEVVPAGFTNAGRWVWAHLAGRQLTGGGINYAIYHGAIWTSDDLGATWTKRLDISTTAASRRLMSPSFAFGSDGYIYAKTSVDNVVGEDVYWYRSGDGGTTWTQYDTYALPGSPDYELVRTGPWFTVDDADSVATIIPTESDSASNASPNFYQTDVALYSPPDFPADYTNLATFENWDNTSGDELLLMPLDANWAGLWYGAELLGLPLRTCPLTAPLLIPHKRWVTDPDTRRALWRARQNWRVVEQWAAVVHTLGSSARPFVTPRSNPQTSTDHEQNYRALERWATSVCWSPGLVIPHKNDVTRDEQNWKVVERWAAQGTNHP